MIKMSNGNKSNSEPQFLNDINRNKRTGIKFKNLAAKSKRQNYENKSKVHQLADLLVKIFLYVSLDDIISYYNYFCINLNFFIINCMF
jgi:hypothetical protein